MYRVERNDIMSAEKDKLFTANGGRRPFTVPDGYFDGLAGHVMSRIDAVEQENCVRVSLWAKARKWVAACACVAVVAGAVAYAGFGGMSRVLVLLPAATASMTCRRLIRL